MPSRKLGKPTAQRTALLRGMVTFLLENGKIETTVTRAKEVSALTEKMITVAKVDNLHTDVWLFPSSRRKPLPRNSLMKLHPNMQRKMVVMFVSPKSAPVAATLLRWQSSN